MNARLPLIAMAMMALPAFGSDADSDKQDVKAAVDGFLRAFENLDMPSFISCFADDASVFFPIPEPPTRFDGKQAIQAHFEQVFAAIRQSSGVSSPPFHRLVPQNLQIQSIGDKGVLVTFEMRNADRVARRTLIFQRFGPRWLITHLHASNVPVIETSAQR